VKELERCMESVGRKGNGDRQNKAKSQAETYTVKGGFAKARSKEWGVEVIVEKVEGRFPDTEGTF